MRALAMILLVVLGTAEWVAAADWRTVGVWEGTGVKNTETFETASREWRVIWRAATGDLPGGSALSITARHADNGRLVSIVGSQRGAGTDTSYVRSSPGGYYLEVVGVNVSWTVTVQDQREESR